MMIVGIQPLVKLNLPGHSCQSNWGSRACYMGDSFRKLFFLPLSSPEGQSLFLVHLKVAPYSFALSFMPGCLPQGVSCPAFCSSSLEEELALCSGAVFLAFPRRMRKRPNTDAAIWKRLKQKQRPRTPLIKAKSRL